MQIIFWIIWLIICGVTSVVFLNFIIAEASASYSKVSENIERILVLEKVNLINESEEMQALFTC